MQHKSNPSLKVKRLIFLSFLFLALPLPKLSAQGKSFLAFLEHLSMPLEVGVANSMNDAFDPGLFFKTSVEYRSHRNYGWCVSMEYDEYEMHFQNFRIEGVNATEGRMEATNLFAGGGYRFAFVGDKKRRDDAGVVSLGALLQPGISFTSVERVTGSDPNYQLETVWQNNFAMKATLQLDYLFSEYFGFFIAEAYTQPFGHQLMPSYDSGVFSTSIGFTSFF